MEKDAKKQEKKGNGNVINFPAKSSEKGKTQTDESTKSTEIPIKRLEAYLKEHHNFRYNEVFQEVEYTRVKNSGDYVTLDEERELPEIRVKLAKKGHKSYKAHLSDLTKSYSFSESFNPFESYFEGLPKWSEGDTDHIANLCSFIKTKDQEWFNQMFKKHLVRTVACALRKIPFNKQCFVLQSEQNDGKTTFLRFLCPDELRPYYKQNPPLDHKDSVIALAHNLIILLDELDRYEPKELGKVKSLFSEDDTKVRKHYGTKDTQQTRYASFFATINETEFLEDVTGNVRWLVFEVLEVLHDNGGANGYQANVNINDVWAQAFSLAMSSFKCELTKDEVTSLNLRNRFFEKSFVEKELIQKHFQPSDKENPDAFFMNSTEIGQCLNFVDGATIRINPNMIGKGLAVLGFYRDQDKRPDQSYQIKGYYVTTKNLKISEFIKTCLLTYLN